MEERFKFRAHVLGKLNRVFDDQVDQGIDAVRVERRGANKEFVDDYSKRPEIDCVVIRKFLNKLWRHIQRRTFD